MYTYTFMDHIGSQKGVGYNINKCNMLSIETLLSSVALKQSQKINLGIPCGVHFKEGKKEKSRSQSQILALGYGLGITVIQYFCSSASWA